MIKFSNLRTAKSPASNNFNALLITTIDSNANYISEEKMTRRKSITKYKYFALKLYS